MKYPASTVIAVVVLLGGVGAAAQEGSITSTRLTEQLHLLSTDQGSYTTNTIAFVGSDGVLLVDTQSADDAAELKKAADAFGKGAPKYIINTHRHVEHVGGNAIFGDGPVVIAHDLVPRKLKSGSYIFDEFTEATFPDITFSDSLTLYFNGERIEMHAFPGSHDDNEIIVHFTESKVVHLSSLVNGFNFPSVDSDGDALKFAELVARAIELLPEDVVIVSGHITRCWSGRQRRSAGVSPRGRISPRCRRKKLSTNGRPTREATSASTNGPSTSSRPFNRKRTTERRCSSLCTTNGRTRGPRPRSDSTSS
jgi:glyoxylase-like metal-dependent hydrolase (beta-lactamase superfamily II)